MENNVKAVPFVDFSKKYKTNASKRWSFGVASPLCVEGDGHLKTVKYKFQNAQGGCEAKGYLYSCMHAPSQNTCCILKHDIANKKLIGITEAMEIGHANDATYNPDENTIVVSYCDGTTRMAILDADTLEHKETVTLEGHVLCNIHYDPVTKVYVACAVQNEAIYVYDKDFKLINSFKAFMTQGPVVEYSMQGCITDGVYVYVLEWHGGEKWGELRGQGGASTETSTSHFNVFNIYTGEHVAVIDTGIPREIEYAAYVDGKFLVGANKIDWTGLEVWELEITPEDED